MTNNPTLPDFFDLEPLVETCHSAAVENGWWDSPRSRTELLALIFTELAEAIEEVRNGTPEFYVSNYGMKTQMIMDEWTVKDGKPEGVLIELAGACLRCYDAIGGDKAGLVTEPIDSTQPVLHFIGAMFDLTFLGVLQRVYSFCNLRNMNLDRAIQISLEYNKSRGYRHGGKKA